MTYRTKQINLFLDEPAVRGPHEISRKRKNKNRITTFNSIKAELRTISVESDLEWAAALMFEGNPKVYQYQEQAIQIPVRLGSRNMWTLDFGVRYKDGREVFYEVKPSKDIVEITPGNWGPPGWEQVQQWCKHNGFECEILTEKELHEARFNIRSWKTLLPHAREVAIEPDPTFSNDIVDCISQIDGITTGELEQRYLIKEKQKVMAHVADLIHRGVLYANLFKQKYTLNSPLAIEMSR